MNIKNQVTFFSVGLVVAVGLAIGIVSLTTKSNINSQQNDLVNMQSVAIARSIANQVAATRAAYTKDIVAGLADKDIEFVQSPVPGEAPLPAKFIKHISEEMKKSHDLSPSFVLRSQWNINNEQGIQTPFEKEGWAYLIEASKSAKNSDSIEPFWRRAQLDDGTHVVQVMTPDLASAQSCVDCHNRLEKSPEILSQRGNSVPKQFKLGELMGAVVTTVPITESRELVAGLQQTQSRAQFLYITVILTSIVVAIFFSLFIGKRIGNPIREAAGFARSIAEGDLTQHCEVDATAETAELIVAMNDMRGRLTEIIQNLTQNAQTVGDATSRLSVINGDLEGVANHSRNQSSSVASAINEMTATVTELARSAESCAAIAEEATIRAQNSNKKVDELGVSVLEIGEISDLIQDIAEQTNLLSLNATIEAARAGDAGSGFAVVATEVKKLANQTANATEKIRNRIEGIESSTKDAVESIKAITESISSVNEVSRTIAAAAEQQSFATSQIAKNVEQTASAAENVSFKVEKSKQAAEELNKQANELRTVVSNFDT